MYHYYDFDRHDDNILTKEALLATGDRYEAQLAQDRDDEEDYR